MGGARVKVTAARVRSGDVLVLPNGREVTVDEVETFDDLLVIRWWRPAEAGEPGYPSRRGAPTFGKAQDGRYLMSFRPLRPTDLVEVADRDVMLRRVA